MYTRSVKKIVPVFVLLAFIFVSSGSGRFAYAQLPSGTAGSGQIDPQNTSSGTSGSNQKDPANTPSGTPGSTKIDPNAASNPTPGTPDFNLQIKLDNPLGVDTIEKAIQLFMGILLKLAIPVIVLFFLWTGISYIMALGNADKIKKVHRMFMYTVIGTLLILGAWTITNAIVGTINAIVS